MSHRKFLSGFTSRSIPTTPAHGDVHGITTKLSTGLYTASVTREKITAQLSTGLVNKLWITSHTP
ncbi:putative secreted protein [Corynebacterium ulcerans 809]|nr:putative secreted protein [Corynebacterium ulcerans 809]